MIRLCKHTIVRVINTDLTFMTFEASLPCSYSNMWMHILWLSKSVNSKMGLIVSPLDIFLLMYVQYIPLSGMVSGGGTNSTTDVHEYTNPNAFEEYKDYGMITYKGNDSLFNTTEPLFFYIESHLKLLCCDTSYIYYLDHHLVPDTWVCPENGTSLRNSSEPECCEYWHSYVLDWPTYYLLELCAKAFVCQPHIEVS